MQTVFWDAIGQEVLRSAVRACTQTVGVARIYTVEKSGPFWGHQLAQLL